MTYRCTWEAVDPGRRKDVEKINAHLASGPPKAGT